MYTLLCSWRHGDAVMLRTAVGVACTALAAEMKPSMLSVSVYSCTSLNQPNWASKQAQFLSLSQLVVQANELD